MHPCDPGVLCQIFGVNTENSRSDGSQPAVAWGVFVAALWVVAVAAFVGVPLIFYDEMQARDRALRSEAEVAQVFREAVEEGIAPASARGSFVVTGMFSGQVCLVEYRRADGGWAGFLARRNPAGAWIFEDVFLTSGVRQSFVQAGAVN